MRVSHCFPAISAVFDDPDLVPSAGLAPTLALAQRAGLIKLVAEADSIDARDLLRHGGMDRLFTGIRAPVYVGHVPAHVQLRTPRQLGAVAAWFLSALAKNAPILSGADQVCCLDIDDTIKATHGYAEQA